MSEDDFKALGRAEDQLHGTDIVLHIGEEGAEFLEDQRIMGILEKYCKFMPVPVICGTSTTQEDDPSGEKDEEGNVKKVSVEVPRVINANDPIWLKSPADLKDEDYLEFYRTLYPMNFRRAPVPNPLERGLPLQPHGRALLPQGEEGDGLAAQQDPPLLQPGVHHRQRGEHRPGLLDAAARGDRLSGHSAQRLPLLPAGRRQREEDHVTHLQEGLRQAGQDVQGRPRGL